MGQTSPIPPVAKVKWLGGRVFDVEDMREFPGDLAFRVTAEDKSVQVRVKKDTEMVSEIASLIE